MKNGELISLADCRPENLVWASGWYDAARKEPTGWHLYQFGVQNDSPWGGAWPSVMPVCRAPSFKRSEHMFWRPAHGDVFGDFVPDGDTPGDYWCHKCIVEIVLKFPEIFQR